MHPGGGRGADRQGRRPDGQVRHRPGAARRAAAGDGPAGRPEIPLRGAVGRRQGAPAGRARDRAALPVRADPDRGRPATARVRLLLRPGAGGDPVHLAARADGAGARSAGRARLREQREGVAAVLDARLLRGGGGAGARRRGGGGRVGRGRRRRRPGRRRGVGRAGPRRPLADRAAPGQRRLPAPEEEAGDLLGQRLRRRLPRGPEGRHRRRQAHGRVRPGPCAADRSRRAVSARSRNQRELDHGRG